MFGLDNCATIGLPPKLIGASLGKMLSETNNSTIYDQLASIIKAGAINIGQQIKHQIFFTKIKEVVV